MSDVRLNGHEARVLGVLIEKALTTPEQYPLSLKAATVGCNQKNNRAPVTDYTEAEVLVTLQGLTLKHLAGKRVQAGSRVDKFAHVAREGLGLDDAHLAVLAELLMRGSQQPGELRARVDRMASTASLTDLAPRLELLIERGYVRRLERVPGERAERYAQTLAPEATEREAEPAPRASGDARFAPVPRAVAPGALNDASFEATLDGRVRALEGRVEELSSRLEELLAQLGSS